ncbi:dispersed gene family protein 1 (DGF-1), partial [Trypanosoma cruzi]
NHLTPSDGGASAYAAIVLLLTTVLVAIAVYGVVVRYMEDRHWQELREPRRGGLEALLRDDEESDEETQKPYDVTLSSYASGATAAALMGSKVDHGRAKDIVRHMCPLHLFCRGGFNLEGEE